MKKNEKIIFIFIGFLLCEAFIFAKDKQSFVYSHGFGEHGPTSGYSKFIAAHYTGSEGFSGPVYPDAPGLLHKAVFYTKPSVIELIKHLKDKVRNGQDSIHLVGFSNGGGITLNALKKLVDYENNRDYFVKSGITNDDAVEIIAAINKGSLLISAPLLHVKRSDQIQEYSADLSIITNLLSTASLYFLTATKIEKYIASGITSIDCSYKPQLSKAIAGAIIAGIGYCAYRTSNNWLTDMYANVLSDYILPCISRFNFDPDHQAPIEGLEVLQGKLTCPILLHINQEDGVVQITDEDKEKLCVAFNNGKMKLLITDDGSHQIRSAEFACAMVQFSKNYFTKSS